MSSNVPPASPRARKNGTRIVFVGVRRDGTASTGVHNGTGAELAEMLFRQRYRSARLEDERGRQIGSVGPGPDGKRVWWGER